MLLELLLPLVAATGSPLAPVSPDEAGLLLSEAGGGAVLARSLETLYNGEPTSLPYIILYIILAGVPFRKP